MKNQRIYYCLNFKLPERLQDFLPIIWLKIEYLYQREIYFWCYHLAQVDIINNMNKTKEIESLEDWEECFIHM